MINFPLRRAVLAVSAAAALSFPAAAQTDAAFASALGKLPSGLATMAQLKTQPQKPAAAPAQGPTAPADLWKEVIRIAESKGTFEVDTQTDMVIYTVKDSSENLQELTGVLRSLVVLKKGKVLGVQLSVAEISETRGEHWVFETDGSGRLTKAFHITVITEPNTKPIEGAPENLDLADPKTKARFDEIIKYWAAR